MKRDLVVRLSACAALICAMLMQSQDPRGAAAQNASLDKTASSVTIYRDTWGVPHVYARPTRASSSVSSTPRPKTTSGRSKTAISRRWAAHRKFTVKSRSTPI